MAHRLNLKKEGTKTNIIVNTLIINMVWRRQGVLDELSTQAKASPRLWMNLNFIEDIMIEALKVQGQRFMINE